jgi:GT2 family glycosyltransferase
MYGEDHDYCNRALWHGFEIGLVPEAVIFHDRPRARSFQGRRSNKDELIAAWMYSHMLVDLKQLNGSFARVVGSWAWGNLTRGLVLIGAWQLKDLLAWLRATLKAVRRLPEVWKHRKIERQPGRHWI